MTAPAQPVATPFPIVALISGRGSNLQALLAAIARGELPVTLRCVISNNPTAPGLAHARTAGVTTEIVDHRRFPDRLAFDAALMRAIDQHQPALVVLVGFMRVLGAPFVNHYLGRLINIHPSLLPAFPGLHTHAQALAANAMEHGATVHFVTPEVDGGPIIVQARVPICTGDTAETLAKRVLEEEHRILPQAIAWFASGRLRLDNHRALLDGKPLAET